MASSLMGPFRWHLNVPLGCPTKAAVSPVKARNGLRHSPAAHFCHNDRMKESLGNAAWIIHFPEKSTGLELSLHEGFRGVTPPS